MGGNVISNIFSTVNDQFLNPIWSGLCLVIATVLAIAFLVIVIRGALDPRNEKRSNWATSLGALAAVMLVAAFAPDFINWVLGLAGGGMGTVG